MEYFVILRKKGCRVEIRGEILLRAIKQVVEPYIYHDRSESQFGIALKI